MRLPCAARIGGRRSGPVLSNVAGGRQLGQNPEPARGRDDGTGSLLGGGGSSSGGVGGRGGGGGTRWVLRCETWSAHAAWLRALHEERLVGGKATRPPPWAKCI